MNDQQSERFVNICNAAMEEFRKKKPVEIPHQIIPYNVVYIGDNFGLHVWGVILTSTIILCTALLLYK